MYTEVDIENWSRNATYEFFKDYEDPFFNFTANVEVTAAHRFCKQNGLSFSLTALYYTLIAANNIREFRIRLVDGRLVEFDRIQQHKKQNKIFFFFFF